MTCTDQDIGKLIGSYELGLLTDEERRQFEEHLLDCEYCFQSLYRTAPITNLIREKKLAPTGDIELADEESKEVVSEPPRRSRPIRLFRRPWIYAAAGITVVALVAILISVLIQGPSKKTERLRGQDEVSILVVSPMGEVDAPGEIQWKAVGGVDSYEVKIYTEAGELVWKSSEQGVIAVIPESIRETLIPGQTYFWQVEALTAEGDRLKSQMIRFRIRK
jgi:hypothetical protein